MTAWRKWLAVNDSNLMLFRVLRVVNDAIDS